MTLLRPRFRLPHATPPHSMWANQKAFMASAHPVDLILSFCAPLRGLHQQQNSISACLALRDQAACAKGPHKAPGAPRRN